ncbi:hypothetical protein ACOBQJ_03365 [Pelotomaculum propionicicum]|uniref:hypothetical protein n=1 Tax=Pelotomaculum propionicicum TaxID=258475 RepID=UPI003B78FF0D
MKIKLLVLCVAILVLSGCGKTAEHEKTAGEFIRLIAEQNYEGTKALSSGKVLYNLSNADKKGLSPAAVLYMKVQTMAQSPNWSEVVATTKTDINGDVDISWHRMSLSKTDGDWKVYKIEAVGPQLIGSGSISQDDVKSAEAVFNDYIKSLAGNKQNSVQYLAGPARRSQEGSVVMLGSTPLFESVESASLTPLWQNKELLVCRADYMVDGRDVKVVVTFARLNTWKIVEVSSS